MRLTQKQNIVSNSDEEKYSSGWRGAPAKGIGRLRGARVQIPPSPFIKTGIWLEDSVLIFLLTAYFSADAYDEKSFILEENIANNIFSKKIKKSVDKWNYVW